MYNQLLAPINGGPSECQGSFGDASAVDFSSLPGTHTFTFTVPPCNSFALTPSNASFGSGGGTSNIAVGVGSLLLLRVATSSVPWIVVTSGGSGLGSGTFTYSVSSNASINARTGSLGHFSGRS